MSEEKKDAEASNGAAAQKLSCAELAEELRKIKSLVLGLPSKSEMRKILAEAARDLGGARRSEKARLEPSVVARQKKEIRAQILLVPGRLVNPKTVCRRLEAWGQSHDIPARQYALRNLAAMVRGGVLVEDDAGEGEKQRHVYKKPLPEAVSEAVLGEYGLSRAQYAEAFNAPPEDEGGGDKAEAGEPAKADA